MSFLENFISREIAEYEEPTREGTPKGEPIGLSKQKYHAALLVGLTKIKTKEIVAKLGISSSGLLRKWKTETEFKKVVRDSVNEFVRLVYNYEHEAWRSNPFDGDRDQYGNEVFERYKSLIADEFQKLLVIADVRIKEIDIDHDSLRNLYKKALLFLGADLFRNWQFYDHMKNLLITKTERLAFQEGRTSQESMTLQNSFDILKKT